MIAHRFEVGERGCFAEVFDDQGNHVMFTAEHCYPQADGSWAPKVPAGDYSCKRGLHTIPTGESFDTFEVTGVAGHTGILFPHPGNLPQVDSDGCFLCGSALGFVNGARAVIISRPTFAAWSARMRGIDTFLLKVLDPQ